jgi:hypothetical protein
MLSPVIVNSTVEERSTNTSLDTLQKHVSVDTKQCRKHLVDLWSSLLVYRRLEDLGDLC